MREKKMQTIEEYREYTKQLEAEVKQWRDAYNALKIERDQLVKELSTKQKENKNVH